MKNQTRAERHLRLPVACLLLLAMANLPLVLGQSAPAPQPAPAPAKPIPVIANNPMDADAVEMSPFIVNGEQDTGYRATSTLAGTRLKTDLKDVGSAITVVTEEFLRDTGARNSEDLLVFTPSTEIGGTRGNYSAVSVPGGDAYNELQAGIRPNNNNRIRGLSSADNTRNFFLTDVPWDSYNTGRVALQRGPNSILFGLGNPSGVINGTLNDATFKNKGSVESRIGNYGSYRGSFDYNHVLRKNELALRIDSLYDKTEYEERPAYNQDKRFYAALRYDPKLFSKGNAHTTLRANFEVGSVMANRPRTLPPIDRLTAWWNTTPISVPANPVAGTPAMTYPALNRSVYDLYQAFVYNANVPGSGSAGSGSFKNITVNGKLVPNPAYQPNTSEVFNSGVFMYFPNYNSPAQQSNPAAIIEQSNNTTVYGIGSSGNIDGSVGGIPSSVRLLGITEPWKLGQFEGAPFYGSITANTLNDPSIFDFYHQLLDGPNKLATRGFRAFNVDLSQTFLNNRAGIDLALDQEQYHDRQDGQYDSRNQMITIDLNATLVDGSPNPNVGRPVMYAKNESTGNGMSTDRQSFRATGFADVRTDDFLTRSLLTRILGRHMFTGLYSTDRQDKETRTWNRFSLDPGFGTITGKGTSFSPRVIMTAVYLGPDLRNTTTPVGLHLAAPTAMLAPTSSAVRYFDSHWKQPTSSTAPGYVNPAAVWVNPITGANSTQSENPANYVGWTNYNATVLNSLTGDLGQLTKSATLNRNQLETKAAVWQGYLFDGLVVPIFGYRQDTNKVYTVTAPADANGVALVDDPTYAFTTPRAITTTKIRSWSVVAHMPRFIREKLPFGTDFSLTYNHSSNFNPSDVGRVDMLGKPLAPSKGITQDYGFNLSTFHDKLALRAIWYKTSIANSSYSWAGASWVGNMESRAWVMAKRFEAGLTGDPKYSGSNFNYGINDATGFVQSAADKAQQAADVKAVLDAFPAALFSAWQIPTTNAKWDPPQYDASAPYGQAPSGYTATRDTLSKGAEFELIFNPIKNWTISLNATKTKAVTTNDLGDLVSWIEARNAIWHGPAGNIRLFSGLPTSDTIHTSYDNNVYFRYVFEKYKNGTNVAELAKWHFNLVTNYSFIHEGKLKGVSVGGAYRWIDKAAVGYPWTYLKNSDGSLTEAPDVKNPVFGPTDSSVNLWCAYERKLTDKITWRVQLNANNALGKNKLIPNSVEPDGSYATYRIKEKGTYSLTNTLRF